MPVEIFGLPVHILIVHAVVVLFPLTCLAVVLHVLWPTARRRLGIVTPVLALVSLALVPVTTNAGDYLERHLAVGPAIQVKIERHEALGRELIWYAIGLLIVTVGIWLLGRYIDGASVPWVVPAGEGARVVPRWLSAVAAVAAIAIAVATSIQLYRIGDAGAHAIWDGVLR